MGYSKTTFSGVFSENSDYLYPRAQTSDIEVTGTPTTYFHHTVTVPAGDKKTPGYVLDLSVNKLNVTPTSLLVFNKDAEYAVEVSWYTKRVDVTGWETEQLYVLDAYTNSSYNTVSHLFRDSAEPETSWFQNLHMGDILVADASDHTGIVAEEGEAPLEWVFVGFGNSVPTVTDYHQIILSRPYEQIATGATGTEQLDNSLTKFTHFTHCRHTIPAGGFLHLPGNLYESDKNEVTLHTTTAEQSATVEIFALEA